MRLRGAIINNRPFRNRSAQTILMKVTLKHHKSSRHCYKPGLRAHQNTGGPLLPHSLAFVKQIASKMIELLTKQNLSIQSKGFNRIITDKSRISRLFVLLSVITQTLDSQVPNFPYILAAKELFHKSKVFITNTID